MNLADLREAIQTKTGFPERGQSGKDRANRVINYALRQLRRDAPESLFSEHHRFLTEVSVNEGTLSVHATDPLVMIRIGATTALPLDGTMRARWLEIKEGNRYVQRRIRDVYFTASKDHIVLDKPWKNTTDTGLTYRIFTDEYPYPADIEKMRSVVRNPETNPTFLMETLFSEEMQSFRLGNGYRSSGNPQRYSRGSYYQLPSPHYTPTATVGNIQTVGKWGHKLSPVEEHGDPALGGQTAPQYGPAGTFSYKVCHVWGRWPFQEPTQEGLLAPFYISASSSASVQVASTWGTAALQIDTPDIDVLGGYGNNTLNPSFHRYGVEKWIFRARHATQPIIASNRALTKTAEDDSVYYLWKVTEGEVTSVVDNGDEHPVDKRFQLKEFNGHYHIRFDRHAAAVDDMVCRVVKRPPLLGQDNDVPHVPGDCFEAIVSLSCAYLVGDRDGNPKRKSVYYGDYLRELDRLKRAYSFAGFDQTAFGDGLGIGSGRGGYSDYEVKEG